jgi:hypothetical protein
MGKAEQTNEAANAASLTKIATKSTHKVDKGTANRMKDDTRESLVRVGVLPGPLSKRVRHCLLRLEAADILASYGIARPLAFFLALPPPQAEVGDAVGQQEEEEEEDEEGAVWWVVSDVVSVPMVVKQGVERMVLQLCRQVTITSKGGKANWARLLGALSTLRVSVFPFLAADFAPLAVAEALLMNAQFAMGRQVLQSMCRGDDSSQQTADSRQKFMGRGGEPLLNWDKAAWLVVRCGREMIDACPSASHDR